MLGEDWARTGAGLLGLSAHTVPTGMLDHHDVSGFCGYFLPFFENVIYLLNETLDIHPASCNTWILGWAWVSACL